MTRILKDETIDHIKEQLCSLSLAVKGAQDSIRHIQLEIDRHTKRRNELQDHIDKNLIIIANLQSLLAEENK